jgi:D-glycero-D-manno-heptose 1,7-bisphosphate phosphatase
VVRAQQVERVVLLDRDGTLVIDRDYLDDPAGLQFLPGAAEALRRLHQDGYRLVIISNQSGVGRGLFSLERLQQINARLAQMVREAGAALAGIYCCPHRPDENCACRKPNVELVRQAARELHFDPAAAVMIGDRDSDIELGRRIGATTIRLLPDTASRAMPSAGASGTPADHVAADLLEAARIIEAMEQRPPVA